MINRVEDQRDGLLRALNSYAHRFPRECNMVREFTQFVGAYPDCFERSLQVGHITGSAWLINRSGTYALFTHHRKLDRWLQVGGHADGDPDVAGVALREAREESGLSCLALADAHIFDLDAHEIPARQDEPAHIHFDVRYLLQATAEEPLRISPESHDLAWFSADQILAHFSDASILRMVHKWIEQRDK